MKLPYNKRICFSSIILVSLFFCNAHCNNSQPAAEQPTPATTTLKKLDRGNFILSFKQDDVIADIIKFKLNGKGELTSLIKQLNERFILPYDINISFEKIGEPNAFFDVPSKNVYFGYEFVSLFKQLFLKEYKTEERAWDATRNTVIFFLLHELGHALVDIYKIGQSANTEDVADNFSIYLLTETGDINAAAIEGASLFQIIAKYEAEMQLQDLPVLDEHLLNTQRFYNLMCKLYASDPNKYSFIIDQGYLDESKTARCASDYESMKKAWERDLGPWLK